MTGKEIRQERRKYDITQIELAQAIGQKPNNVYISMLERGKIPVSEDQINKILSAIKQIRAEKEA